MKYGLLLISFWLVLSAAAYEVPPGSVINLSRRTISIHPDNYNLFISGYKPDSAVVVYRQPKFFEKPLDSSSLLFEIQGASVSSFTKSEFQFTRDPALNRQFIRQLVTINDVAFFRIFYKNASGQVYKYQDISVKGKKTKEAVLTDAANLSVEIQKFYESGTISNRTQYISVKRDTEERFTLDSLWFDLKPKLVKSGKEDIYYANQNLRLSRIYAYGKLKDTTYTEFYSDNKIKKTYQTADGRLSGTSDFYDRDGKLLAKTQYENGLIRNTSWLNKRFDDNKKAFLFGIDHYGTHGRTTRINGRNFEWPNLAGCVNDVNLLQSVLVSSAGFNPDNIYSVTDENATMNKVVTAFSSFCKTLQKGDVVFVHFSGHGYVARNLPDSLKKYEGLLIPCSDANSAPDTALSRSNNIFQYQVENFFNAIKKQIGKTGQLIISMDVSHAGELLSYGKTDSTATKNEAISYRGESNNILFNLIKDETTPVILYSASSSAEDGTETRDENDKVYGAYTLAFVRSLTSSFVINSADLYEDITNFLKKRGIRQNPGYLASETQFLFEEADATMDKEQGVAALPLIKPSGKPFLLSVGISDYPGNSNLKLRFNNCKTDAMTYSRFFEDQFDRIQEEKNRIPKQPDMVKDDRGNGIPNSALLINQDATKENILAAINNAISNSKPNDYFIFNFSGYCKPLKDTSGKQVTYFVPFGLTDISDTAEIRKKGISLTQLKDLFQLIPANNQLFITEAGSTDDFQKEFIQALIETSPTIASLSNKNRIFIVPKGSGLDKFNCNGIGQEHGPLNYCVTNLPDELNVFGLFEGGIYADAIKFAFNKTEIDCDYFRTDYFDIFFERDFINSLRYFLPEDIMKSRGAKIIAKDQATVASTISKKYALVVGTNIYSGKPQWDDLEGVPELDATDISRELETNYGFIVTPLINKPSDSIYENILRLSRILKPTDQLLIYVAGHGDYDSMLFDDGFIVCTNSKPVKADPYRNSYIQYSKLSRMINRLPSRQILMVLDVCFGGTFDERVARSRTRSQTDDYADLPAGNYLAEKLKIRTRLYLTSGGKKEVPNGYKGSHSPFAQRFLQCLQTKGGSGKILTATDFFQYVKMLPSGPLLGSFGDDDYGSEFIMLAK